MHRIAGITYALGSSWVGHASFKSSYILNIHIAFSLVQLVAFIMLGLVHVQNLLLPM